MRYYYEQLSPIPVLKATDEGRAIGTMGIALNECMKQGWELVGSPICFTMAVPQSLASPTPIPPQFVAILLIRKEWPEGEEAPLFVDSVPPPDNTVPLHPEEKK